MPAANAQARPYRRFECPICGHVYDEAEGDPDSGIPPGTRWEDIPDEWECPVCHLRKSEFAELLEGAR